MCSVAYIRYLLKLELRTDNVLVVGEQLPISVETSCKYSEFGNILASCVLLLLDEFSTVYPATPAMAVRSF